MAITEADAVRLDAKPDFPGRFRTKKFSVEKELRILIVEDVLTDVELEVRELTRAGMHIAHRVVETEKAFRETLAEFQPELILSDFTMPHFDGMWALEISREAVPNVPFIFVSGTIGEEYAIRALKNGATDYVLKNNLMRLPSAIERALEDVRQRALRAKMENELIDINERFRLFVENVRDYAIIGMDLSGKIVSWNAGAKRVIGYDADEILGKHFSVFYPEGISSRECDDLLSTVLKEGSKEREGWRLRKDGARFWGNVLITAIVGKEGDIQGYVKVTQDLTKRKLAEDAARENYARYRTLFNAMTDGFCLIQVLFNADGHAVDNRFLETNAAFLGQTGLRDTQGKLMRELMPEHEEHWFSIYGKVAQTGEPAHFVEEAKGLNRWFDVSAYRVGEPDTHKVAVIFTDITERKKAEAALLQLNEELENKVTARTADLQRAQREAEEANQAKSSFLATMSHEIRTPMNGVVGMIDVLHQSSLKGDQVEMVKLIRESAFSLLSIIEDILDFSKIEAGKLEVDQEPIAVAEVVEGVCGMLNGLAEKRDVALTLYTDPYIPERVLGDTLRLRQVLINLANNAIKFCSAQLHAGQVSVRALLVEKSAAKVTVEIRVTDNGIGMDEKTQARLFTAFTQANVSTTRRFGGTGLGLAIAGHLVKLMGGEITVQSAPGAGTTFTVRLPYVMLPPDTIRVKADSEVAGLSCVVVGAAGGLADDLAVYLKHGSALVERVSALASAGAQTTSPSGLSVWVVEACDERWRPEQVRAAVHARVDHDVRFVIVLIERGKRCRPRVVAPDMITIDGNALNRRTFLKTVAVAAGRASLEVETEKLNSGRFAAIAPSRDEALRQRRLILVAEDNEINQKVIVRQLALLGYTADVVADGHEGLTCWRSGDYALLLTDLHMPEMDGYELTKAIRAEEKGGKRIPIIALTANALKGEAEHCREVGMDDYRSKPCPLVGLKAVLDTWLPVTQSGTGASPPSTLPPAVPQQAVPAVPVDVRVLKGLVGNDPDLIREFLQDYRASAARIALELRAACAASQTKAAAAAAHKLKSSACAVGAFALGELCAAIEEEGKTGDSDAFTVLLPRFEAEMAVVEDYLDKRTVNATSTLTILAVDDEPFMLKLHLRLLSNLGYTSVSTCKSGSQALEMMDLADKHPDLILLDLNMPEMDGIEFLRHLVKRTYTGSVVLVSGEDERVLQAAEKLVQAHQITSLGHLRKPVNPAMLAALMDKWTPPVLSEHWTPLAVDEPAAVMKTYAADEVRAAIANGELINYYQPKVSLTTGHVIGVETLVRWRHSLDGLVFPDEFIGVAEAHGLICDLTCTVIAGALQDVQSWQAETGLALQVAVNVSMDDLGSLDFVDYVTGQAAAVGVLPNQVVLEVTESQLMQDLRVPLEVLTRLRLKRFRISIDDFGTGHSSLAQLRDMPFDELKIDRGFVHRAWTDETVRAIFDTSVMLAKQLGMDTVTEGVEDRADWDFVRQSGCDIAQGYFIARPMPAEALQEWIEDWEERALVTALQKVAT